MNQCPHNLDLWQWICGMPSKVTAHLHFGKWHDIEVEDDVTAYVEYPNGATGTFITSTGDLPGTNRLEVCLDGGKIVAEMGGREKSLKVWRTEMFEPEFSKINTSPFGRMKTEMTEIDVSEPVSQHMGVFRAFAANILRGEPLIADGREGINGLTLSNSMHLSAWTGTTVDVATFDHEKYYEELMERVKTSRGKSNVATATAEDMDNTFGA